MLTVTVSIVDEVERIATLCQQILQRGDLHITPFEMPELQGQWRIVSYGYRPGASGLERLIIELIPF